MANKDIKVHDENDKTIFEYKLNMEKVENVSAGSIIGKVVLLALVVVIAIGLGYFLAVR